MNKLSKMNDLWKELSEDERIDFIKSKIQLIEGMSISLESISGSESLTMNFGSVSTCPTCGK
ncbi:MULTISPECIES: hypothetical protein [Pectobacterium]|uniref:hypothetical protein n=1 Tax=Pectobacterium TaxID=122277 RepID=UPI0015DDB0A2|nr:hypothetical protein [Pectobacterium carotovorum]MBA0179164.1 hypothetical protein [Pectobacterium carotovorum]GKW33449.1 hypothetical protein PEC730217_22290 [Pectobacterium carotovorum subsp. carotovorum]